MDYHVYNYPINLEYAENNTPGLLMDIHHPSKLVSNFIYAENKLFLVGVSSRV